MIKNIAALFLTASAIGAVVPAAGQSRAVAAAQPVKQPVSYAQLLADYVEYQSPAVRGVAVYARPVGGGALAMVGQTGDGGPQAGDASVARAIDTGQASSTTSRDAVETMTPLLDARGNTIGALSVRYRTETPEADARRAAQTLRARDFLQLITPELKTLYDPYMKGYDRTDPLAQRINQILLGRHPDVNVIAIHITAPGDAKNKVWGINRPNFIGRDSDEIDTDTEKTSRIVMQVIPATHRMEVHMPLLSPRGETIGTLCTVYFWNTVGEAADYYGRSLAIMEEARLLTPTDRGALFRP